ncbi:MAG: phenylalanine--tRNA ligase subunit alpha [Candidatus Aenigmarchaeota archaeon]|nr:phenylalanine--tRNA ligase subunit alpha [Candidatus Aenigmarchaeota archaeon]
MSKEIYYRLTQEGKDYLEKGLPEKTLVEFLNNNPKKSIKIEKAIAHVKNFSIGLKWAMDKGWIDRDHDEIFLVKMPVDIHEQKALERIAKNESVDDKLLETLLQRKLVEKAVIGDVDKLIGKEITNLTSELLKTGIWKQVKFKSYNVEITGKKIYTGKRQPYNQFLKQVRQKLVELGFEEMAGPLIETEFWNFDSLYQPQNHPARDWTQTYQLKYPKFGSINKKIAENVKKAHEKGIAGSSGWGYRWDPRKAMQLMPRAHGTALSARTLADKPKIPGKYFAMVRCFRPDIIDATHGVEFNQTEGIVLDESLNFKHLLGILKMFAIEIAGAEKVKFLPDYYPFTEISCQLSALHPNLGWIEFGGSGIFREELTNPLGVDVPVLAWGIGIDRLAMFKLNLQDIRHLFSQNLEWLRNQKVM